jgi:nucleotide-binding universal stress UspA family protein
MWKRMLIPTDGSDVSNQSIEAGVQLAKILGARVVGFFAAPAPTPIIYSHFLPVGLVPPEEHARMIEETANKYLSVVENAARKAGVDYELVHVTNDFPAEAIVEMAQKKACDVIFIASHGRRGRRGPILGSETQKVASHATIPVVIFRNEAAATQP